MRKSCQSCLGISILLLLALLSFSRPAYADNIGLIFRGVAKTIFSVMQIPGSLVHRGAQSFPLGLVTGTLEGSVKAVAGTLSGATDIARGAAPYAKYMVFFM